MRTRPALLTLTFTILALLIGLPVPDATYSANPSKYAHIQDDDPNPLPKHASPEDKQLLHELLESRALQPLALPGPPPGTLWTPSEYESLEGVLIRWGSYNSLLTEFVVGITAASANLCTGSGTPYACCTGSGTGTCDIASTKVFVSVDNSSVEASAYSTLQGAGADMSQVEFIICPTDTVWIRDYGPRFIVEDESRAIIDHTYNRPRPYDDAFNDFLSR